MISPLASASTLPFSRVISRARSSARSVSSSQERRSTSARCRGAVAAHPGWASAAGGRRGAGIGGAGVGDRGDDLLGARVDHVEALAALGGAPLAADEEVGAGYVVSHAGCSTRPTAPVGSGRGAGQAATVAMTEDREGQRREHEARRAGSPARQEHPAGHGPEHLDAEQTRWRATARAGRCRPRTARRATSSGDEQATDDHRHQHDEGEEAGVAPVERGEAQDAGGLLGVGRRGRAAARCARRRRR